MIRNAPAGEIPAGVLRFWPPRGTTSPGTTSSLVITIRTKSAPDCGSGADLKDCL
jgi:hypothetical protein